MGKRYSEYVQALDGEGPWAQDWKDKPHKLVLAMDLENEEMRTALKAAYADLRWFIDQGGFGADEINDALVYYNLATRDPRR